MEEGQPYQEGWISPRVYMGKASGRVGGLARFTESVTDILQVRVTVTRTCKMKSYPKKCLPRQTLSCVGALTC